MIDADLETPDDIASEAPTGRDILEIAKTSGDISGMFSASELSIIGSDVVRDYELDLSSRKAWEKRAKEALASASQEAERADKTYPFPLASDVKYPILTVAALQFQARAYPAIFKGDEVVQIKIVGSDKGRPMRGPDGAAVAGPDGAPQWEVPPGMKAKRATRVKDYMNVCIAYRMADWEADTDAMLLQLPIVGCGFRKLWWDSKKGRPCAAFVPALRLVVPNDAKSLETAPRVTEEIPDMFPFQIRQKMRAGFFREVTLSPLTEDEEAPRPLLEQHRYLDLDDDGLDEPYIVTVDQETRQVLRIEANFSPESLDGDPETGRLDSIEPGKFYVKYGFIPHPEGKFYDIGFGHLLAEITPVIDTAINQMIDAGHAQIAGGGFIAGGVRLQGNGQSARLEFRPGEYKVVNSAAGPLKDAIWERTLPSPDTVLMSLLDLMLGAARDIAAIKDVTSGDASNNGQVGTTLALIEQGLAVFTAIYKRLYRGLRAEFQLLYDNLGSYGDERTAADYMRVLDDPDAVFRADFNAEDMDIRPVSDPTSVTRMQKMARAQFLAGLRGTGFDDAEINRRILEAADIEDQDKLLPPKPQGPPPEMVAQLEELKAKIAELQSKAALNNAKTAQIGTEIGAKLGEADGAAEAGADTGRLPAMAGQSGDAMGDAGPSVGFGSPESGMDAPVLGLEAGGPAGPV